MAEDLVALYRVRDPQRFELLSKIDASVHTVPIPPLLLLGLVENAIKHGPAAGRDGPIELEAFREAKNLVLRVRNPGLFIGPREGGEGLLLIQRRLLQSYGPEARFHISDDEQRTTAELVLPGVKHG
jgi:LytS/YehU family sensor histidine kinase